MPSDPSRPPGGHGFEAVRIAPEGWVCLAPWIQTIEGHWWRPQIAMIGGLWGQSAEAFAEHLAQALNRACAAERE